MNSLHFKAAALVLYVSLTSTSVATPVGPLPPQCVTNNLAAYQSGGSNGCRIGLFTLSDFEFNDLGATPISATDVTVEPVLTSGEIIMRFSSVAFSATADDRKRFSISYIVNSVNPPPVIFRFANEIVGTSTTVAPALADVFTQACATVGTVCPPGTMVNLHVFHAGFTADLQDEAFLPLSNYLTVENVVDLQARGASAGFSSFENRIGYIPEPASVLLFPAGMLLIAGLRLRRWTR
jgi:hypothetical protein